MSREESKLSISTKASWLDPLMLTWRVCRVFGLAPVQFRGNRPQAVSTFWCFYGYVLMVFLHACIVVCVVLDLRTDPQKAVRVRTPTARYAWFGELVFVFSTTTAGILGAKRRMEQSIHYLNVIDKIKFKMDCSINYNSFLYFGATGVYIVAVFSQHFADHVTFIYDAISDNRNNTVICLLTAFYLELIQLVLIEVQFMWISLYVKLPLEAVNKDLREMLRLAEMQMFSLLDFLRSWLGKYLILLLTPYFTQTPISVLMTKNMYVDLNMLYECTSSKFKTKKDVQVAITDKIRRLVILYGATCDVIKQVSVCYGLEQLLTIGAITVHNVVTPFYFVAYLHSPRRRIGSLLLQLFFLIFHATYMAMLVEPGYQTEHQVEQIRNLVGRLWQQTSSPLDPLAGELDLFMKQIELNKPCYSPLRTCVLTRSFLFTMIGGATTYLVIILQFQKLDIYTW